MKGKKIWISVAFCSCMLLSGCSGNYTTVVENETVTPISFSWWGVDARNEYTLEGVQIFEQLNPLIKVECNYAEWTGFKKRIDMEMASHTLSDVLQINYSWLADYSSDGTFFYDLSDLKDVIDFDDFTEEELSYGMVDGKLNALPIAMNSQILYYNQTLYDTYKLEIPKTWDDLFAAAKVMSRDGIYPMSGEFQHIFYLLISYTEQITEKRFMEDDGSTNFTKEDYEILLDFYKRLVDEKVIPHVEDYEKMDIQNRIYAGNVCWISDAGKNFQNSIDEGQKIMVGDFLKQSGKDTKRSGWYYKPATMYAISGNTQYPKEAGIFLNYLINSSEMASLQQIEKGVPVSRNAYQTVQKEGALTGIQFEAYQKMKGAKEQMELVSRQIEDSTRMEEYRNISNRYLYQQESLEETALRMVKTS